jgi:DUF2892 family protein
MFDANESGMDRTVRLTAGIALLTLGWTGAVGGAVGLAFKIIGFGPLLTGIFGWCPLYTVLHFNTQRGMRRRPAA